MSVKNALQRWQDKHQPAQSPEPVHNPTSQQPTSQPPNQGAGPIERAAVGGTERQKRILIFRSGMVAYFPSQLSGLSGVVVEYGGKARLATNEELSQLRTWLVEFCRDKRPWFRMSPQESKRWELYILQLTAIQTGQITNPSELKDLA